MNSVYILVEAKKEYTNQLQKILTPRLYEGFKSIYEDILQLLSNEVEEKNIQSSSIIKTFQKTLREIPQWNHEMIKKEFVRIERISNCDYFDDLLEAIFITNTKILTSVQVNDQEEKKIKINIPQGCNFIHKCYMECAKEIYKNPYIYDQSKVLTPKEKHNNLREALALIELSINNAIRDLLPIRDILRQGITKFNNNEVNFDSDNETSITEIVIKNNNQNEKEEELEQEEQEEQEEEVEQEEQEQEEQEVEEVEQEKEQEEEVEKDKEQVDLEEEVALDQLVNLEQQIDLEEYNDYSEKQKQNEVNHNLNQIILVDKKEDPKPIEEIKQIIIGKELKKEVKEVKEVNIEAPKKVIVLNNDKLKSTSSSPSMAFIKEINPKKFLKNKYVGGDKNSSFYKKKYEENSANYNSVSDTKPTLTNLTRESLIIKNKIMIDDNSSDESEDEIVLD